MMSKIKLGKLKTSAVRLCGLLIAFAIIFGLCGVFAAPVSAAGGMTPIESIDFLKEKGVSVDIKIRNLDLGDANKYALLFGNSNEFRIDGVNTVAKDTHGLYNDSLDSSVPVILRTLGEDGYPQLKSNDRGESIATMNSKYGSNSLKPIFDDGEAMTAKNTPFKQVGDADDHAYSYNSEDNHAYFDTNTKTFTLYKEPLRPFDITEAHGYAEFGAFLPFNNGTDVIKLTDGSGNKITNASTEGAAWNAAEGAKPAANMYVTPHTGKNQADNWFAMSIEFSFYIPEGGKVNGENMVFEFSGDDDVYVYVDDVLLVDQGGTHKHTKSSIDFATGEVKYQHYNAEDTSADAPWPYTKTTIKDSFLAAANETGDSSYSDASLFNGKTLADFSVHKLTFFFMERGGEASNCKLNFNLPVVPDGALSVQKKLDGIVTEDASNKKYTFVLSDNENSVMGYVAYSLVDRDGNVTTAKTDANGQFKLSQNEMAIFNEIEAGVDYSVLQITEAGDATYSTYTGSTGCTINGAGVQDSDNSAGFNTGKFEVQYDEKNQTKVVFTNTLKQDKEITITNEVGKYMDEAEDFTFTVKIEGLEDQTITLKHNESITIKDIPVGAKIEIVEEEPEGVDASSKLASDTDFVDGEKHVVKALTENTTVNYLNEIQLLDLEVNKIINGSLGNKSKKFDFTVEVSFKEYPEDKVLKTHQFQLSNDGKWTLEGIPYGAVIEVKENPDGYTPTLIVGNDSTEGKSDYGISKLTKNTSVTFKNVKDGSPNTGISLDSLPYIILLILAGAGAAAFVIRRRRPETDQ